MRHFTVAISESEREVIRDKFYIPNSFPITFFAIIGIGVLSSYFWGPSGAAIGSALGLSFGQWWQRYLEKLKLDSTYRDEFRLNDYKQQLQNLINNGEIFTQAECKNIEIFFDNVKHEQNFF